jgi:exodeoxyribonuclease VII small subunit
MGKKAKSGEKIDFEKSMDELEKIVNDLESGALTLDESIKAFERGVELSKL